FDLGGGQVLKITDRGVTLPCAPGHEIVGRVAALGPGATGVAVGDERIVYPWVGCGTCELCLSDNENLCYQPRGIGVIQDGGFGSHLIVPDASYLFPFGDIDPAVAATFACSGLTAYSAIRKLGEVDPDAPILLVGAGGVGLVGVKLLQALGHTNIIVADVSAEKRQGALDAGASAAIDNSGDDAVQRVLEASGGLLQAAIDFVGIPATVSLALECLGKKGRLVLVGVGGGEMRLSLPSLIFRPRSIIGTITGSRQELRDVIALAQAGKFAPGPITRMAKDDANAALEKLERGDVIGRIVLADA
ncbi:MAG: zinc-binding dehydrogenase, partial [Novosphingobium sp.]|nr:zinc-binding dehydrogenase [Novosphingobium sp.]